MTRKEMAPAWTLNVMGNGATDPNGGGEPQFGNRDRTGLTGIPDSLYRRMRTNAAASVKDGRYYLQLAGAEARERLLLAAAKVWGVPVEEVSSANSVITHGPTGRTTTYGKVASLAAADAASESRADPHQAAVGMDADGDRAEESRCPFESHRQSRLRHRRSPARHEMGGGQIVPRLWRQGEELRFRARSAASRASSRRSSSRSPIRN